jgi:hypothetical protein
VCVGSFRGEDFEEGVITLEDLRARVETLEANDGAYGEVGGRGSFGGKASIWRCDMLDCVEWLKS